MKTPILQLLSESSDVITIPDIYQTEVRELAEKGIDMERIAFQVMPTRKERQCLIHRMLTPGDVYNDAYVGGAAEASSLIDEILFGQATKGDTECAKLLEERRVLREQRALRLKLFGV